jgi:hypothetical protein
MWIVRFLNGPLAGQVVPLEKESTLIGRASHCDIKVPSSSISKEHTRIEIFDDKIIVTDAGSRNGTFLNGVQVRSSIAKTGDKVALHDIFFEVHQVPEQWSHRGGQAAYHGGYQQAPQYPPQAYGNAAYQQQHAPPEMDEAPPVVEAKSQLLNDLMQGRAPKWAAFAEEYMERVVLPGVFKLTEMFEFKWVLAGFMAAFIVLVTTLSMIPLVTILRHSLENESQNHALTIATTLARVNRPFLVAGQESSTSVEIATSRPGVRKAYLISNLDGNIIAPASAAGSYPDISFVHDARKYNKEAVQQIDSNTIVAMVPVAAFNQDTGLQTITHWGVVVFDMSALAIQSGQILSLFITTLFISLILGVILFFFLYKTIEHPISQINLQLDQALKDGGDSIQLSQQFPALQTLASNVSSALNRLASGSQSENSNRGTEHDRNREISNLTELIGFAAMGIRAHDHSIAAVNQAFESRMGSAGAALTTMTVNELSDQALKLSIKDLIERVDKAPDDMATNDLDFSGSSFQVIAQSVFGTNGIAYYLIVLIPNEGGG